MDDFETPDDREARWARGLREGDREVFEDLFRTLYADLVAYAQSIVHREEVAEGVVQEVFLRLWERNDWSSSDDVTAYGYRSVHNRALNAVRDRRSRTDNLEDEASAHGALQGYVPPDRKLHTDQLRDAVKDAIKELPDRRRQIFLLSRRHDLTYAQIANILDISERTVETQIRRALQALRDCVSDYE